MPPLIIRCEFATWDLNDLNQLVKTANWPKGRRLLVKIGTIMNTLAQS